MTMRTIDPRESDPRKIAAVVHELVKGVTVLPGYTATVLGDKDDGVNTFNKRTGKGVWDSTNELPLWASGPGPTDAWNDATGSASITPS